MMLRNAVNQFTRRYLQSFSHSNSVYTKPKRFYKEVALADEIDECGDKYYSILLDNRQLKTQAGKVLKLESEPLALAIAQEWDAQKDTINKTFMRLTGLTFTAIDNPLQETKESLTEKIMEYLDTDTLLYYASDTEPEKLIELQNERWSPIIKWVNDSHDLDIRATNNLTEMPQISDADREKVKRWLLAHNFWTLNGIQYGVEGAKSLMITMALMGCQISAEVATECSRLEQMYQTSVWGNVEWSHDMEHHETCGRLSAALLFYHFTANSHKSKQQRVAS